MRRAPSTHARRRLHRAKSGGSLQSQRAKFCPIMAAAAAATAFRAKSYGPKMAMAPAVLYQTKGSCLAAAAVVWLLLLPFRGISRSNIEGGARVKVARRLLFSAEFLQGSPLGGLSCAWGCKNSDDPFVLIKHRAVRLLSLS